MLPAPSLEEMRHALAEHRTEIIGVLFAPPYTNVGKENLVPRLGYLDGRSDQYIHFFCAGYGGYDFAEDIDPIGDIRYDNGVVIPWGFSQSKFLSFVNEIEGCTSWQYSGESDLILTGPDLAFDDCILFDIQAMVKDGAIDTPSRLFEAIIRYARDKKAVCSASGFSDCKGAGLLGEAAIEGILVVLPKPIRNLWKRGLHYRTRNLTTNRHYPRQPVMNSDSQSKSSSLQIRAQDGLQFAPKLHRAVNAQLGLGAGYRPVCLSRLDDLQILKASVCDIKDLLGIDNCANLTELYLECNDIANISPLSALTKLRKLYLKSNQITDIHPLERLTHLTHLNLGANVVADIAPIRGLINLKYLYLSMNRIADIKPLVDNCDAGGLGKSDVVYLNSNPLSKKSAGEYVPYLRNQGVTIMFENNAA